MQRWHLFTGFALTALLAAAIVPTLQSVPTPSSPPSTPSAPTNPVAITNTMVGPLSLSARLDQQSLVQGVDGERYMVLEITAPDVAGDLSRPVDVSVVMDVSSSMAGRGKITQSRRAVAELIEQLRPTDTFSLVTFSDQASVEIRPTPVTAPERLKRVVKGIRTNGGTNIHDGIELGLAQMEQGEARRIQRVVLLSDGLATVGRTDPTDIIRATGQRVSQGVSVSTIGLGLDFDENLLMAMSDTGGGTYQFVDRPGQLSEMFASELHKMTQVVGREVALNLDLGPNVKLLEVYGYDTVQNGDDTTIFVGDVHGGEKRKVVARVQIPDDQVATVDVADVALEYVNVDDGTKGLASVDLNADIVNDAALAKRSIDKDAGVLAVRAAANDMLARGAAQFANGRSDEAKQIFKRSRSLLRSASAQYETRDLDTDMEEMSLQAAEFETNAPSSSAGRRAVKKAKEVARVRSR